MLIKIPMLPSIFLGDYLVSHRKTSHYRFKEGLLDTSHRLKHIPLNGVKLCME